MVRDTPEQAAPSDRVHLVAPIGRDGALLASALRQAGQAVEVHPSVAALCQQAARDGAGVLIIATEALAHDRHLLLDFLADQPAWSDVPVILLIPPDQPTRSLLNDLGPDADGYSVTLLPRPLPSASLVSTVRAALRARARQYEVQRLMAQLQEANERLEERVEERTQEVRKLATALTMAEQRERHRIASLLHDDLQQMLYGLQFRIQFARRGLTGSQHNGDAAAPAGEEQVQEVLDHLDDADAITNRAVDAARTLTVELSPPVLDSDGLEVVFEWLADHMREMHGLHVDVEGTCYVQDRDLRVLFFQLGRELLFNVVKHAGTHRALVSLEMQDGLAITRITDDGEGFEPDEVLQASDQNGEDEEGGFGLYSVQERVRLLGGQFEIDARPGEGTTVAIIVPLDGHPHSSTVRSPLAHT